MTYIVRLSEEAEYDLEQAASWYELQRHGLGHDFLAVVTALRRKPTKVHDDF